MNQKKVVIIGSAYPLRGGLSNFNERLARAFDNAGYSTTIYSFSLQYPSLLFPGKTQYSSEYKPDDLDIRVVINSINPFNWIKWGRKIRKQAPDLVIMKFWIPFMAPCLGTLARIIRSNKKSCVITIIDNLVPHEKRLFDKPLAKYFARSVDGFIAMSREVLNQIDSFNSQSPKLFSPHPVYDNFGEKIPMAEARNQLGLDQKGRYMLFFGFIRDYKGLSLLLEAMTLPEVEQHDIRLIVAGEFYTDPKHYLEFIEKQQLGERVILHTKFIPDSRVSLYFSAVDLVVQPYKHATQSGVTQIAYHFEVPMVVTNVGGLAEFIPDGKVGYVVEPTPKAVANGILRFFDTQETLPFIKFIKEEKKRYSWEYFLESILNLYEMIKQHR